MHNGYAGKTVPMAKDCIGSDVEKMVNGLQDGEVFRYTVDVYVCMKTPRPKLLLYEALSYLCMKP
jgi:hypothetical protein